MSDKKVIENLARIVNDLGAKLKERPEVVRCKDCAMRGTYYNFCPMLRESVKDDFFCGWGKRKDGESNG